LRNADCHSKNIALLYTSRENVRLAPVYDMLPIARVAYRSRSAEGKNQAGGFDHILAQVERRARGGNYTFTADAFLKTFPDTARIAKRGQEVECGPGWKG
jgi:hypothetical protein